MKPRAGPLFVLPFLALVSGGAAAQVGNIDPNERHAFSENGGWLDFRPVFGGVTVGGTYLSGYAWLENAGWVKLGVDAGGPYLNTDATNWGVNHDFTTGALTGYAWSESAGWIRFGTPQATAGLDHVTLKIDGHVWSENLGWIHLRSAAPVAYGVATTTVPVRLQAFTAE